MTSVPERVMTKVLRDCICKYELSEMTSVPERVMTLEIFIIDIIDIGQK